MAGDNKIHIQDYLDGLLSPEACHDFEMHIQEDSELRRQVEEARLVREIWRSVKLSDTDLDRVTWSTLDTQIAASIAGQATQPNIWHPARVLVWAAACGAIMLGVYVGTSLYGANFLDKSNITPDAPIPTVFRSLEAGDVVHAQTAQTVRFREAEITLSPGAKIRTEIPSDTTSAVVLHAGQARFRVSPRAEGHRFQVVVNTVFITVVGTEFDVIRLDKAVEIQVIHGKVAVTSPQGKTELSEGMKRSVKTVVEVVKEPTPLRDRELSTSVMSSKSEQVDAIVPDASTTMNAPARNEPQKQHSKKTVNRRVRERKYRKTRVIDIQPTTSPLKVHVPAADSNEKTESEPALPHRPARTSVDVVSITCADDACRQLKTIFRSIGKVHYAGTIGQLKAWITDNPNHRNRLAARYAIGFCEFKRGNRTAANRIFSERAMSRWITSVKAFENPPKPK
ncbi:MAG: FecR domain-containing protein [Myxococcota bacterium]|nr:FecR domain-containing protein [Myxococcota bacterium]